MLPVTTPCSKLRVYSRITGMSDINIEGNVCIILQNIFRLNIYSKKDLFELRVFNIYLEESTAKNLTKYK